MCPCKKNARLRNLEGFFDYAGSSLPYKDVYSFLLTSLYQLDDNGNKVLVNSDNESGKFIIDIDKPLCVGALFDNTSNLYNDIAKYGFKPINNYDAKESENSVIIDANEDSVLPISCNEDTGVCTFDNNVRLLSLPRVNFYIYTKYDRNGNLISLFDGNYKISRNGYTRNGIYNYPTEFENTSAIDEYGNIIQRAKASVLMLPSDNVDSDNFRLYGIKINGGYREIGYYIFDSSVSYGQEVDADQTNVLCHVNFVNADSNHANLVPTDSCQFVGTIKYKYNPNIDTYDRVVPFGKKWGIACNDIFFPKYSDDLLIENKLKGYLGFDKYIQSSLFRGMYNTRFINKDKQMYLYNIEGNDKHVNISDTIELAVKRLPVINLTGKLLKSDFDSSKPYIYIVRDSDETNNGLILCNYDDLDSHLVLQVTDKSNEPGKFRELTMEASFTIFCSSTAPNDKYQCLRGDNSVDIYKLVCNQAKMNGQVRYTLTKI